MPSRYISHPQKPPVIDGSNLDDIKTTIHRSIGTTIEQIHRFVQNLHNDPHGASIYIGLSGITLMEIHLSELLPALTLPPTFSQPGFGSTGDKALLYALQKVQWGDKKTQNPSRSAFLGSDVGVATLALLRIIEPQREAGPLLEYLQPCVQLLKNAAVRAGAQSEYYNDGCEVLFGRAGLLYALLRIRKKILGVQVAPSHVEENETERKRRDVVQELVSLTEDKALLSVVQAIIEIGREGARDYAAHMSKASLDSSSGLPLPPLMWTWFGKRYLGGAHGVAGILHILWNCPPSVRAPYTSDLIGALEWFLSLQDSTGNWPSKAPDAYSDPDQQNELVQWCHGATGALILLSSVALVDGVRLEHQLGEKVKKAMREGSSLVYRHGLLKKGVGICHGVAGSVYALLAASQVSDGDRDTTDVYENLNRAVHLAQLATGYEELTTRGEMSRPDHPWSLYEGVAGMCCAWAKIVHILDGGRSSFGMPGFDDLV